MKNLLFVAMGGMLGSVSRYLIQSSIVKSWPTIFPYGTFTVNLLGSFLIGVLLAMGSRYDWLNQETRLLLVVGFCGSFTTFSTFAYDGLKLIQEGHYFQLAMYFALSLIAGVFLVWLGFYLFKS